MKYKLFLDETCHLENDHIPVMCIGYMKVPNLAYTDLRERIINLKMDHRSPMELKWNKFSASRMPFYKSLVDLFFDTPLEFRCILLKNKNLLTHSDFRHGSHDNFYYMMIYFLLKPNPPATEYNVLLDVKDTGGKAQLNKIQEIFTKYHGGESPFTHFQHIRSEDNVFIQLADFFIGAIAYKNRQEIDASLNQPAKNEFIAYLEERSRYSLTNSTPPWITKFNIFDFEPGKR